MEHRQRALMGIFLILFSSTSTYHCKFLNIGARDSILEIASGLTRLATLINPTGFICETWIFPFHNGVTKIETFDTFTTTYKKLVDVLRPILLLQMTGDERKLTNFSYSTEFQEHDILNSNRLGVRQLTPNCATIIIQAPPFYSLNIVDGLIAIKYARPHKDFFVFVGTRPDSGDGIESNELIQDIRYKYTIRGQVFQNHCGKSLPPFHRKCDTHVRGRHFQVTASSIAPFVHFDFSNGTEETRGIIYSLFKESSTNLNFTFDIRYSGFLGSSGFKKNGTWFGAVGEVFKREADVAFGVATTVHRFPINDPSVTKVWITRYFYIRSPPFSTSWESIFWPLSGEVWSLTAIFVFLCIFPACYACAFIFYKDYSPVRPHPLVILQRVLDTLWAILLEQSGLLSQWKLTKIRLFFFLWAYFCIVILTGYRSKLISFLTFLEQAEIPQTHKELSLSDYKLFFRWMGGVAYRYTATSSDPMHKRILKRAALVNTSSDGLFGALFEEHSAWLDYSINADFAMNRYATFNPNMKGNPLFIQSKDSDYTCHIVWSFRKGSPLVESFDPILLNLLAAGLYDYYKDKDGYNMKVEGAKRLRSSKDPRIRNRIKSILKTLSIGPKPLNEKALFGLFIVFILGTSISVVVCLIELLVSYGKNYFKQHTSNAVQSTRVIHVKPASTGFYWLK